LRFLEVVVMVVVVVMVMAMTVAAAITAITRHLEPVGDDLLAAAPLRHDAQGVPATPIRGRDPGREGAGRLQARSDQRHDTAMA
jgi:hypothetical protein